MSIIKKINTFLSFKILGRNRTKNMIAGFTDSVSLHLLDIAHQQEGIFSYGEYSEQSEKYVAEQFLPRHLKERQVVQPVFFDVGANVGNYSLMLQQYFPAAVIYSFEPNPSSFKRLQSRFAGNANIHLLQKGLGAEQADLTMYSYGLDDASEHASMNKDVMKELHEAGEAVSFTVPVDTLDAYCRSNAVDTIDFLKIDVEGFELEVLKGAKEMISRKKIGLIQFEFNEMNVYTRVFLKDFYELLPGYSFYRLLDKSLLPLGAYNPRNEIFRYQNIMAVLQ
ncbi:MAG: FkbM family methyltransferase [Ferruginibacter sp.]